MSRILRYLRPFALSVALALLLVLAQSLADLSLPTLMSDIVDKGIALGDIPLIWRTGARMLLFALGGVAANVGAGYLAARVSSGFGRDLRSAVFTRVSSFSLRGMDVFGTSSLITRTTNDITQVQQLVFMMMRMMAMAPMMAVGGIVMAVTKEPKLAWILLVSLPVITLAILAIAGKGIPLFREIQKRLDALNRVLRENLSGIRVIRAFNRQGYESRRFDKANAELTGTTLKVNRLMAALFPVINLVMNLTTVLIVWFGGFAINRGEVQIGSLMAFIQYAMQIMFSVLMVSVMFIMVPRASVSADRIREVLETDPEIRDPETPATSAPGPCSVEFRDVTFRYHGAEEPALKGVSFRAEAGKTTAIIGGTGSGKTTVLNLIERFYDVDSGAVLVDGIDVRRMSQTDLRSRMGMATQKAVLFSGTVRDNILFGADSASEEDMRKASDIAQASDFILKMEGAFDAPVAQGGTNVSGGQKQRLAIARVLARSPRLFLFDDSFSALDFRTDAALRAALRRGTSDATVIIVAQRVGTIRNADSIVVLEEGRVAGRGTHSALMKDCPVYREIVASQLTEKESA